jgi:hypothetical protein
MTTLRALIPTPPFGDGTTIIFATDCEAEFQAFVVAWDDIPGNLFQNDMELEILPIAEASPFELGGQRYVDDSGAEYVKAGVGCHGVHIQEAFENSFVSLDALIEEGLEI